MVKNSDKFCRVQRIRMEIEEIMTLEESHEEKKLEKTVVRSIILSS